jgi:hypothetical protein
MSDDNPRHTLRICPSPASSVSLVQPGNQAIRTLVSRFISQSGTQPIGASEALVPGQGCDAPLRLVPRTKSTRAINTEGP